MFDEIINKLITIENLFFSILFSSVQQLPRAIFLENLVSPLSVTKQMYGLYLYNKFEKNWSDN